jgi:hypothetical protein
MTTPTDSFTRSVQSALTLVHELDSQEAIVLTLMDADSELALDDAISGDFPLSAFTFGLLWRANQQIKSCLLVANSTDGSGPPLVEELPNWVGLLKESMESSALAWWVLGPVDRRTRVTRRLELAMHECRELRRALQAANLPTSAADEAAEQVRRACRAADLRVQARYPLKSALHYASRVAVTGKDLLATHALTDVAADGSRDALRHLGQIPVHVPGTRRDPHDRPDAMAGFAVGVTASILLMAECHDRHVHLRRSTTSVAADLRGAV